MQSLPLLIRTLWLEVLEIQIFNHLIVHLQILHLNRSLLSIMLVIPQSLSNNVLKNIYFISCFCRLCLPHLSRSQGVPRPLSQPQNNDQVMTRHSKKPSQRKKCWACSTATVNPRPTSHSGANRRCTSGFQKWRQRRAHKESSDHSRTSNTQHGCDYHAASSVKFHQILTRIKSPEKFISYVN